MLQNVAIFWEISTFTFLILFLTAKYSFIMTRKITIREARCLRHQLKGVYFQTQPKKGGGRHPCSDTTVTLIGKPLPAKKDFYSYSKKDLALRNLAGREGAWVHFSPRYSSESGTSSLKLISEAKEKLLLYLSFGLSQ